MVSACRRVGKLWVAWSFWGIQGREKFKGKVAVMALKAIVAHLPANIRVGLEVLRTVTRLHTLGSHSAQNLVYNHMMLCQLGAVLP